MKEAGLDASYLTVEQFDCQVSFNPKKNSFKYKFKDIEIIL